MLYTSVRNAAVYMDFHKPIINIRIGCANLKRSPFLMKMNDRKNVAARAQLFINQQWKKMTTRRIKVRALLRGSQITRLKGERFIMTRCGISNSTRHQVAFIFHNLLGKKADEALVFQNL